jgi:HK97 family phage major capsid protein
MYSETLNEIKDLEEQITTIERRAERRDRVMDSGERKNVDKMQAKVEELKMELPVGQPLTVAGNTRLTSSSGPFPDFGSQLLAVRDAALPGQKPDERLFAVQAAATGLGETIPSSGGFLVQTDFTDQLLLRTLETGLLAKQCLRFPISSNSNAIKLNAYDETSRASTRFGGVLSYWLDEGSEKIKSKPKFRQMELNLKKLIGICYASDELLADTVALESVISRAFSSEFGFRIDDAIINGTGAGQPLGILASGSLVSQAKETGQANDTIMSENCIKMLERTLGPSRNYVWLHSKTVLSQIYTLHLSVGTGGIPLFIAGGSIPNFPENRLLGLPLIEVEQCPVLGDLGDIILANLQDGYVLAEKDGIKSDVSIHVQFLYDESVFRFVIRVDGQPVRASELTPYKGGANFTQSHFIALEAR